MNNENLIPPKLAERLLTYFISADLAEEVLGDLDEKFYSTVKDKSVIRARLNYWYQVLHYLRPFAVRKSNSNQMYQLTMYGHYFKIAWRTLLRQKMYSSIKIGGFSIGIASCLLISLFVIDEKSYDRHYEDGGQIYRLANSYTSAIDHGKWTIMQAPIRGVLYETFPEVEKVSRLVVREWQNSGYNQFRGIEDKRSVYEEGFIYADPEILEILEIPMIYGDQINALSEPNTIVLSRSKADKHFPDENPVGKQVVLNDGEITLTIGGVMEDFQTNSHLQGDFIITLTGKEFWDGEQTSWCCSNYEYYLKLQQGTDKKALEKKLIHIRDTYVVPYLVSQGSVEAEDIKKHRSYYLQPVENIYLSTDEVGDMLPNHGVLELVWILSVIAVIILLLAVINFVNLSTAKSANRAKEVGLRKVIGSQRISLIGQYLSESILYSFTSIVIGVLLAWMVLPGFNILAEKAIVVPWFEWWFIPILIAAILVIGIISGLYPSLYLSAFKPIEVLKGKLSRGSKSAGFRSGLVVFQFTTSIVLIISALVVHKQMQFFLNKELGFDKEQVITIQSADTMGKNRLAFKTELLNQSEIQHVTISNYLPIAGTAQDNNQFWKKGMKEIDQGIEARIWRVDYDYINTLGMNISDGRNFSMSMTTDNSSAIIINQKMANTLGLDQPIGTKIDCNMDGSIREVIGVVDDFHFSTLARPIGPLCMILGELGSNIIVKVQSDDIHKTLQSITGIWDEFMPNQAIRYGFLDERFANTWTNETLKRLESIFLVFASLAIFIACLGLFALSAFTVEQRSKEISIRKVLGASIRSILGLLTVNFLKLIIVALLVAVPVGWYFMDWFLEDFSYRIDVTWTVFALSGLVAIFIALLTISFEAFRAALSNPADKLRSE